MGMYDKMFKGQAYKFVLTNNNNKNAFKFGKSASTWQSGEFDRAISLKSANSIDLMYTLLYI